MGAACNDLRRREGVTLVELMVAVGIVAVLGTLAALTAGGVRSSANRVTCANNLARIGQVPALQMRPFERSTRNVFAKAEQWILPTLDQTDDPAILRCPEGGNVFTLADLGLGYTISGTFAIDFSPANNEADRFEMITPEGMIDRGNIRAYAGQASLVKLRPQGSSPVLLNGVTFELADKSATTITAPTMSVILFNTSSNGKAASAWNITIAAVGATLTPPPPGAPPAPKATSYYVSYGINPLLISNGLSSPRTVLAMDYDHLTIQAGDGEWQEQIYPFARHGGKVNVLLRDGSVHVLGPQEVSPAGAQSSAAFWQP